MIAEIVVILALIALNGVLAMSELAIVSARPARLKALAEKKVRGARRALSLSEDPGRFLSTVQIGISLVGVLAGAFSGATLGLRVAEWFAGAGFSAGTANTLGVGLVVVVITYLSLVIGELVPKQIALRAPERVAVLVAPTMDVLSRLTAPLVWFLNRSGKLLLRLLGQSGPGRSSVSDEEVRILMDEAADAGVIEGGERDMIAGVMRVADRSARGLMTPRREVDLIDLDDGAEAAMERVRASAHSHLPVCRGNPDNIIGILNVRAVLAAALAEKKIALARMVVEVPAVLDVMKALDVTEKLRASPHHMVLVYDEHGHFEGIITPMDLLGAITGHFDREAGDEPKMVERADHTHLVAGWMSADEFAAKFTITLPEDRGYETVAGLVLDIMGTIPEVGETCEIQGVRIEVVDRDGKRIDKLLVTPRAP